MTPEVESLFISRGFTHSGMLLLRPSTALDFVDACRQRGIELLGFDAFRLLPEDQIQPIMDDSLDLSTGPYSFTDLEEKYAIAERFIRDRMDKNIVFEMVTG